MADGTYDRPGAFSPAECDALVALAEALTLAPALVHAPDGSAQMDRAMRSAAAIAVERDGAEPWLFDRLDALFAAAAAALGTSVHPVFEPVQIVRYRAGDHFALWHSDAGVDRVDSRRISASVELSDPAGYQGGLLEIAPARMLPASPPPRGHATLFPSRALHRVTPVTRGARYALVAWTGLNPA